MLLGVSLHEILWLALALLVGGMISGVLAGMFGVSGGSVIVPVLYEAFRVLGVPEDVRMQLCLGTSIAIVVPTTIRSYLTHRAKGVVIPGVIRQWTWPAVIGVACSAAIASFAPAAVMTVAFVAIASFIALKLLFAGDRWNLGSELPGPVPMALYGFGIGFCGSLMGVSGGAISTIVLTVYGKPIHNAVATSSGVAVPITIAGAIGFVLAGLPHQAELPPLSLGFISLIGLAVTAPIASFVAPYGAHLAHRLPRRTLEIAFGGFLLLVSLRFLVSLI
ncbi:MAG: sulfite exporter TauE/SafE family protein [Xanthobacteraceae bacterium]